MAFCACSAASAGAITLPPGFENQHLANVGWPTGLAFTPDGRLLMTSQPGQVLVYKNGALKSTPAIDITPVVCNDIERGLDGIAVDPAFADTHYVYLYYTYKGSGTCSESQSDPANQPVNRLSRFVLGDNDVIDPTSEFVLIDNIPQPSGNHNGGDIHFGKDGYLYLSIGDGGCDYSQVSGCGPLNNAARYPYALTGKIVRITSVGGIPPDNPHVGGGTARCNTTGRTTGNKWCQEIWATGLRNPFRFAMDENSPSTRLFINDVGLDTWEEIDLGASGADYGWNVREGHCAIASRTDCGPPPAGMTNPIYDYDHNTGCTSVTAGSFVPTGLWPSAYDGKYLYADFVCHKFFQLAPNGSGGYAASEFGSNLNGGPVASTFGPYGSTRALYYMTWGSPPGLERIAYVDTANRTPTASATASPTNGDLPLDVSFDGSASADPDNDPLTYDWDFGDGSAHSSAVAPSHTYTTAGTYTATLRVSDGRGAQATTSIRIDAGNNQPDPTISSPADGFLFDADQDLTLSGSATDPEDGALDPASLSWEVVKHHATHIHPFLPPTSGNDIHITAPEPEDLSSVTNTYLEIRLTATDSHGLKTTVVRNVYPHIVNLGLIANYSGVTLQFQGFDAQSPVHSWAGWHVTLNAPSPQFDSDGKGVTFVSWSDGGAQSHQVTTPESDTTYSATFTHNYARPKGATPVRVPLVIAYRACASPNSTHGAPLASPSCSPPAQASDYATVGTPDANGLTSNFGGQARLKAQPDNPATPIDEADVGIKVSATDVLDRTRNLDDYVGQLMASLDLRITDRANGTAGTDTATVSDTPFAVVVPCTLTPDSTAGSACSVQTSADAVVPGAVTEGERSIWEVGQVQVFDGGSDGLASTDPNTLFAVQGLFVP